MAFSLGISTEDVFESMGDDAVGTAATLSCPAEMLNLKDKEGEERRGTTTESSSSSSSSMMMMETAASCVGSGSALLLSTLGMDSKELSRNFERRTPPDFPTSTVISKTREQLGLTTLAAAQKLALLKRALHFYGHSNPPPP